MAIWIELRCERRGDGRRESSGTRCWSDDNLGPGDLADDNQAGMIATYRYLKESALSVGWREFRGEGWVCPNCQKHMVQQQVKGDA